MNTKSIKPRNIQEAPARLQLTSLVDMMVILVVFLLMSFSVEGQLITPAEGLELSPSTSDQPVVAGLVIEVGPQEVRLAGRTVQPTASLAIDNAEALKPLLDALSAMELPVASTPVLLQVDRRVPYSSLSKVLGTCSGAGWANLSLVVLGAGS